ncbi:LytR/AlgR family response regulator transcription factor [Fibrella forsythiae]|uniref:Response regulator transcription factor n=1 Tax=Fibrella forsythiae TaxID=2817061 RepID=A0ABS3JPA5_9BACT|nr:LytTR family DNA-binding domain-containing protein [Fibrella forsythiae]MBO0951832.1 response regulator transcription factor [Fibrella forsythiae]
MNRTIAIIEDTIDNLEVIEFFLHKHRSALTVVGNARSVDDAHRLIAYKRPDIVLLDIQIIGGTSFDVLARLNEDGIPYPQLIFITAHGVLENATKALRYAALDFITKPIDEQQLSEAINRAIAQLDAQEGLLDGVRSILEQQRRGDPFDQLVIRLVAGVRRLVNVRDLVYFEAQRELTYVYLANGERLVAAINIGYYTRMVQDDHDFLLIHQSYLVNSQFIDEFDPRKGEIRLKNGQRLSTSKRGNQLVRDYYAKKEERSSSAGVLIRLRQFFSRNGGN